MRMRWPLPDELTRRVALRVGFGGLGAALLPGMVPASAKRPAKVKNVIFLHQWGGPSHHDTVDMKPEAPSEIRGEFKPVPTRTPGLHICEHLPELAKRSEQWALCRSLTHKSNDHSASHHIMLTGRTDIPPGFDPSKPKSSDWPAIAALAMMGLGDE